jgi:uncharacterized protein
LEVNLGAELPGWQRFPAAQEWLDGTEYAANARKRDQFDQFMSKEQSGVYPTLLEAERQQLFRRFLDWYAGESNHR